MKELHKFVLERLKENRNPMINIGLKTISRLFNSPHKGHLNSKNYLDLINIKLYYQDNTIS